MAILNAAPRQLVWGAIRLLVFYVVLTAAALLLAERYGHAMLPIYEWEIGVVAPKYQVVKALVMDKGIENVLVVYVLDNNIYFDNGHITQPGVFAHTCVIRTLFGLQHIVLLLLPPLSWPGLGWRRRGLALVYAIPFLIFIEAVDIPLEIIAHADQDAVARYSTPTTAAMEWVDVLSSGGRFALSLLGGVLACLATRWNTQRTPTIASGTAR